MLYYEAEIRREEKKAFTATSCLCLTVMLNTNADETVRKCSAWLDSTFIITYFLNSKSMVLEAPNGRTCIVLTLHTCGLLE